MMPRRQIFNLVASIATVVVFGFTLGLMFPLLSLIMEQRGVSADWIGFNTASQPLGIVLSIFVIPHAIRRFGSKAVAVGCAVITACIILAYPNLPVFWWWFVLRVLQGFFVSMLFAISEAWIVRFAEGPWRSRLVALYACILSLSFGGGPSLISFTGIEGLLPFVIGACILAAAILPMFLVQDSDVDSDAESPSSVLNFFGKAPALLAAVGAFGIIDSAFLGFLPVYAVKKGLSTEAAAFCLTMFIIGNTVLLFPIGWLADKFDKSRVLLGCAAGSALMCLGIPFLFGTWMLWPLLMIGGAATAGLYTVALAVLGDRFSGHDLTAGTASFSFMWGFGALFGALITGWAFEHFGPDGMPFTLAAILLVFLCGLLYSRTKYQSPKQA